MTETTTDEDRSERDETYVAMFDQYVTDLGDIAPAERPLVHHVRKICRQLDHQLTKDGVTLAAKDGAYLQAIERLNKRLNPSPRPTAGPSSGEVPGQTGVFEFLDDESA